MPKYEVVVREAVENCWVFQVDAESPAAAAKIAADRQAKEEPDTSEPSGLDYQVSCPDGTIEELDDSDLGD